tara:strand:+ start:483 stop:1043 length:561 start_codon:yes stop_codon:yes gene_type:complete
MKNSTEQWRDGIIDLLPRLRRFAFALTGSVADADDLLQATVEKALVKHKQFTPGTDLDKWLFRMCKNTWIDEIRGRRVRGPIVDPTDYKSELHLDGEELIINKLRASEVHNAINSLQDEQRMILALIIIEGYSYKEVSKLLNIPIGTVMSRLSRARSTLIKTMNARESQKIEPANEDLGGLGSEDN